jgi:hypothetical protein
MRLRLVLSLCLFGRPSFITAWGHDCLIAVSKWYWTKDKKSWGFIVLRSIRTTLHHLGTCVRIH